VILFSAARIPFHWFFPRNRCAFLSAGSPTFCPTLPTRSCQFSLIHGILSSVVTHRASVSSQQLFWHLFLSCWRPVCPTPPSCPPFSLGRLYGYSFPFSQPLRPERFLLFFFNCGVNLFISSISPVFIPFRTFELARLAVEDF